MFLVPWEEEEEEVAQSGAHSGKGLLGQSEERKTRLQEEAKRACLGWSGKTHLSKDMLALYKYIRE